MRRRVAATILPPSTRSSLHGQYGIVHLAMTEMVGSMRYHSMGECQDIIKLASRDTVACAA